MTETNRAVLGIFQTYSGVASAVDALTSAGFASANISVLFNQDAQSKHFALEKGTQPPEDTAKAKVKGGVVGAAAGGVFAGVSVLAIPALAPLVLLGAGPLMLILAEFGAGGAPVGIDGALRSISIPEHEAEHYEIHIKNGAAFICVHTADTDSTARAKEILERSHAQDIVVSGGLP